MNKKWYCVMGGERRGPLDWEELVELCRGGALGPDDLVWQPEFGGDWRTVATVEGLAGTRAETVARPDPPSLAPPVADILPDAKPLTPLTGVPGASPSFAAAVSESWGIMKRILFRPLDLARWFSMGFCAWLATLGSGGCSGSSFPDQKMLKNWSKDGGADPAALADSIQDQYRSFMAAHPGLATMILALVVTAVVVIVAWAVVSTWLRARGAFMLVHRWHKPDDTVGQSWAAGRGLGRSLFIWRLAFGSLMVLLLTGLGSALVITVGVPFIRLRALPPGGLIWLAGLGCGLLVVVACWCTVNLMLDAFVVPVMYWRRVGVLDAWRVVLAFSNEQPVAVMIFLTLWPLLVLAGVLAILALVLCTCCIFCIPLLLPYVNQVALLPLTIFMRGVGICFLKQWRPDLQMPGGATAT